MTQHKTSQNIRMLVTTFYPVHRAISYLKRLSEKWRYQRIVKLNSLPIYDESATGKLAKEIVFAEIFRTLQLTNPWLAIPVYPVGGAINYGFLYILSRALIEYRFNDIIEFGVGQTTRILSAYANYSGNRVVSVESDINWVKAVSSSDVALCHTIIHAPLKEFRHEKFGEYYWYDLAAHGDVVKDRQFDLFLIDGPVGMKRRSRIGIVENFLNVYREEWVMIWDDLHRSGDLETFGIFVNTLKGKGVKFDYAFCVSTKTVGIVYTKKFHNIRYYV